MRNFCRGAILLLFSSLLACSAKFEKSSESASSTVAESPACTTTTQFPSAIAVTGSAVYQKFVDSSSGLVTKTTSAVRYAEIVVTDTNGAQVNCSWTDASGAFSIPVPRAPGAYLLKLNSRGESNAVKASVLRSPSSNLHYFVQSSFNVAGTESSVAVALPTPSASGTLEGGAFNIFDQIVSANDYLRANVTGFVVAPKVAIYWSPGVTPGVYIGSPTSKVSFFNSTASAGLPQALYILGGMSGSVCTDTDHFDNSVILHEYGHFLENKYSVSDSPGGSHNGNQVIDPRLAWSEGWANFFQAAVLTRNVYRDTTSNSDCGSAALSFPDFSMENKSGTDVPTPGILAQGGFREISVARSLYDVLTGASQDTDTYYADVGFEQIWNAFVAMGNSNYAFRSAHLFNQFLYANVANFKASALTDLQNILNYELQPTTQTTSTLEYYGANLKTQSSACTSTTQSFDSTEMVMEETTTNRYLRGNNRFYRYDYGAGTGQSAITLAMSTGGNSYDLDIYVYRKEHSLGDSSTIVARSTQTGAASESISLAGQPAGSYLIRVSAVYKAAGTTTTFNLRNGNGEYLCP